MERRDRVLTDEPTLSMTEAAWLAGMSEGGFKRVWKKVFQFEVRHVKTSYAWRVHLMDMIEAVYPGIPDLPKYMLAQDFLWRARGNRRYITKRATQREQKLKKMEKAKEEEKDRGIAL